MSHQPFPGNFIPSALEAEFPLLLIADYYVSILGG
jgi:hypothetical protein